MDRTEEKIIKEVFEEDNGELPEAPASANIKVWIDGYGVMLTMRGREVNQIVEQVKYIIDVAKKLNWKSSWKVEETNEPDETKTEKQVDCKHINVTLKKAGGFKNPANKDKLYNSCLDCGKFLDWK